SYFRQALIQFPVLVAELRHDLTDFISFSAHCEAFTIPGRIPPFPISYARRPGCFPAEFFPGFYPVRLLSYPAICMARPRAFRRYWMLTPASAGRSACRWDFPWRRIFPRILSSHSPASSPSDYGDQRCLPEVPSPALSLPPEKIQKVPCCLS